MQYRIDDGAWVEWLTGTAATAAGFVGEAGHVYRFRVRTWDRVGNERAYPAVADATTRIRAPVTKYYYANGQRVALRQGDVVYWILTDHLGSTALTIGGEGQRVGELRYYPYGQTRVGNPASLPTDYTFTGQRWEAGLGLMHYGARWYDPALGRFVQADTVVPQPGEPQALNRYAYVYNNPLRFVDPLGHQGGEPGTSPPWWAYWLAAPFSPDESNPLANLQIGEYRWTDPEYHQFLLDYYSASAEQWSAGASDIALVYDTVAVGLSGAEAAAADVIYVVFVGGGAALAGPEGAWAGLKLAVLADVGIAQGSPLAGPENALGGASLFATFASDFFAGHTGPTESGFAIGQDTLIAGRNMMAGFIPESNLDLAISLSQLKYDLDRRHGVKEGSSIEISREQVGDLLHLIFLEHWW